MQSDSPRFVPTVHAFLQFSVLYQTAEDALMARTEARLKNIRPVF